ncbi:MAG: hypothetical protein OEN48_13200 [Betaproteobacteria bacterium]|nr:hypothetical protein [Betaproteobacteria bacterium]
MVECRARCFFGLSRAPPCTCRGCCERFANHGLRTALGQAGASRSYDLFLEYAESLGFNTCVGGFDEQLAWAALLPRLLLWGVC